MASLATLQAAYLGAVTASTTVAVVVLACYHRQRQNTLVRVACCVLLVLAVALVASLYVTSRGLSAEDAFHRAMLPASSVHAGFEDFLRAKYPEYEAETSGRMQGERGALAYVQVIVLHYLTIVLHALLSCSLVNSLFLAFGKHEAAMHRGALLVAGSFGLPLAAVIILVAMRGHLVILPGFFHFYVHNWPFVTLHIWILLLGLPGVLAGFYLLGRTVMMRIKSRAYWRQFTQITLLYLLRVSLCNVVFLALIVLGSIPWRELAVCMGPFYGLAVFLMYGFGEPARKAFKELVAAFSSSSSSSSSKQQFTEKASVPEVDHIAFYDEPPISLDREDVESTYTATTLTTNLSHISIERRIPVPIPEFPMLTSSSPYYVGSPFLSPLGSPANRRSSAPSEIARKYTEFFSSRNLSPSPPPPQSPSKSTAMAPGRSSPRHHQMYTSPLPRHQEEEDPSSDVDDAASVVSRQTFASK